MFSSGDESGDGLVMGRYVRSTQKSKQTEKVKILTLGKARRCIRKEI